MTNEAQGSSSPEAGAVTATPPAEAGGGGAASAATPAPAEAAAAVAAEAAPATETPAAEAAKESQPSLLGAAEAKLPEEGKTSEEGAKAPEAEATTPATEAKPETPAEKPAEAKDKEAAPADEGSAKPQPREYEAFKLPEGVKLDDKRVKEFTNTLDDANLSHQDRAQKLVDFHVAEMERVVKDLRTEQISAWKTYTDSLKSDFKKDPEFGGNRQDTSLGIAKSMLERFGGTKEQVSDMMKMLDHTGMGNYVGIVRLLNNVFEQTREGNAVPAGAPSRAGRRSFQDTMYGDQ